MTSGNMWCEFNVGDSFLREVDEAERIGNLLAEFEGTPPDTSFWTPVVWTWIIWSLFLRVSVWRFCLALHAVAVWKFFPLLVYKLPVVPVWTLLIVDSCECRKNVIEE